MNETLEHHGILGMKWGVRRYQNKDGTLTEEGKEHRAEASKESDKLDEETRAANKKVQDISGELMTSTDHTKARAQQAAITGLNALKTTGLRDVNDPDDISEQMWFLYEDQTIGLPQIADLANKGYSEEKIKSIVSEGVDAFKKSSYWPYAESPFDSSGLWCLYEGSSGDGSFPREYVKACVDYVKSKEDETRHSDTSSDELQHHGILGMKWGVRRYQNKDGSLTPAGRKRYGDDTPDGNKSSGNTADATPRTPAKPASEMTDQELNQALNRLRMEQQYNEMTGAKSQNNYQNQKDYLNPPSNTGALSNAELQSYITRLELEKRYSTLTAPPPKKVGWGEKFVKETLPAVAMEVAREYTKSAFKKMLGLSGDNNDGGNNQKNNDNGGKKKDDGALNKIRERLDRNEKQMSALERAIVPANKQKSESKSLTKSQSSFADGLIKSMESSTSYKEHRNSITNAARDAANAAREKKKQREQLQKRLAGYRSDREKARAADQDRYTRAATDNSDYYRSMWTYGM